MPLTLGNLPGKTGALLPLSLSYIANTSSSTNLTSYSFAGVSVGATIAPGNTRYILVAIHGSAVATAGLVSSVTIGGVSASLVLRRDPSDYLPTEIWAISNNGMTSATIDVVFSQQQFGCCISTWQLVNPTSLVPSNSNSAHGNIATLTRTLTVASGGVGMGLMSADPSSGAISWTNATEQYDRNVEGTQYHSGAYTNTAGTYSISATKAGSILASLLIAAWT